MNGASLQILLVEDNLDHAELIRRHLGQLLPAHRPCHVEDGAAALDYLFGRGQFADRGAFPLPDLVLLDLRLPKVDGLQVLRQVKSHPELCRLPVVMLTSSAAERDAVMAYECQANYFVTKPLDTERFVGLLKELGFHRSVGDPPWSRPEPVG